MRKMFFLISIYYTAIVNAQSEVPAPQPELSAGIKIVNGEIIYGKKSYYRTNAGAIGVQPELRYDFPVKTFTIRDVPLYIDLVGQIGYLYYSGEKFDRTYIDPNNGNLVHEKSANASYVPAYFGIYNVSAFALGVEIFYWKGLGVEDIWGTKFLSLGYNGRKFRIAIAGEIFAQVRNGSNGGTFFSFEFLWKIGRGEEY